MGKKKTVEQVEQVIATEEEMTDEEVFSEEEITEKIDADDLNIPDYIQQMEGFNLDAVISSIISVDDEEEYVKAVVYGDNGSGKTTFGATAPGVIFIDANEKGTQSVRGSGAKKFVLDHGWQDIYGIYWYLKSGKHSFKTVVIDTCTQLEDLCLKYVINKDAEEIIGRDPEQITLRDYGQRNQLMKSWLMNFRDLPMNVIFLLQRGSSNEEVAEDEHEVYPMLSEKIRKVLCGAVDIIAYTYTKETLKPDPKNPQKQISKTKYLMRIGPSDRYLTKVRVPKGVKIPNLISDPTFDKLYESIYHISSGVKDKETNE